MPAKIKLTMVSASYDGRRRTTFVLAYTRPDGSLVAPLDRESIFRIPRGVGYSA